MRIHSLASLFREPLVHFLLAGALVFALFGGAVNDPADRTITVSEAQIQGLASQWEATWQREPAPAEVDGLIRDWVKDEIYYREAVRLGLDKDDIIMRRRMRSKMEFLVAAQSESEAPSEAALQGWLDAHKAKYATNPALSFDSIFIGEGNASVILTRLKQGAAPESLGSPLSVPAAVEATQAEEVDRIFGEDFAKQLTAQPLGTWAGPVESGFGRHFVRVRKVSAGSVPPLTQIRKTVENDWREANRQSREVKTYQALLDGYTVRIAKP